MRAAIPAASFAFAVSFLVPPRSARSEPEPHHHHQPHQRRTGGMRCENPEASFLVPQRDRVGKQQQHSLSLIVTD
ncbi:hypothetical protein DFJ73DRAFT_816799 [Zopfochytrium polystomum]|nr:hypothetical protein DFJ73DRAFT_816799 [Zopfochytrium polystomum]